MGNVLNDLCTPVSNFWGEPVVNTSSQADFSPCFEETALAVPPFVFLFLLSVVQFGFHRKTARDSFIRLSKLHFIRSVVTCMVGLTAIIDLCVALYDTSKFGEENTAVYQYLSPCCRLASAVLAVILLQWNRKKGIRSSGTLTIFWLLMVIYGSLKFRTYLLIHSYGSSQVIVTSSVLFGTATVDMIIFVGLLCLSCIPDKKPVYSEIESDMSESPERWAPFLSQITYWWMNGLFVTGFKRPLTNEDLWSLLSEEKTSTVSAMFLSEWQKEMEKAKGQDNQNKLPAETNNIQLMPLNEKTETDDVNDTSDTSVLLQEHGRKQTKLKKPSLLRAMGRAFGRELLFEVVLKFIQDILLFVSPQLLKLLIEFILDKSIPLWHGYVYASLLFVVAQLKSIVVHQYFQLCNKTGLHLRAALMDIVYRKSLHLSNSARRKATVGEIVNLMSVDAQRFFDLSLFIHMIWSAPLQICLAIVFLWQTLGPSILAGIAVVLLLIPINSGIAGATRKMQVKQMGLKDQRIKIINEILSGIKVIKLYAWEKSFLASITDIRRQELLYLKKAAYLNSVLSFMSSSSPFLISVATFATYSLTGNNLTPQKAFVSLALFNIIRFPISMLPSIISRLVQSHVSLRRLSNFLQNEELDPKAVNKMRVTDSEIAVAVNDGSFRWEKGERVILQNINLKVKRGSLVGVVGIVGSGKSSLLSVLLGEMERDCGQVTIRGSVAYVGQIAWIQNAPLKNNILFSNDLDEERYEQVIEACSLNPDLEQLPAGDMTEIGEKGINLSGGQKQRVALARAVYSDADIYLLDDPLSAVDAHVGEHLFNHVIGPAGLLKDKVRILVTHGIAFLPHFDHIIVMTDGFISETGTYKELLQQDGAFADFLKTHSVSAGRDRDALDCIGESTEGPSLSGLKEQETDQQIKSSKEFPFLPIKIKGEPEEEMKTRRGSRIIHEEETEKGVVKRVVCLLYARAIGIFVSLIIILMYIGHYSFAVGANIWLSRWSDNDVVGKNQSVHRTGFYLGVYSALCAGQSTMALLSALFLAYGTIRAARLSHTWLLENILHCPMSFFDTTPLGRIVNRFSKDILVIDEKIPESTRSFLYVFFGIGSLVVVVSYSTPLFLSLVIPIGIFFVFVQRFYVASSRQLMRLESVTRSPIFSHFQETLNGTSTIRAFGQVERFIDVSQHRMDLNLKAFYPYVTSNRWLGMRLEFIGNCIVFFSALFAVIERGSLSAGVVGLSISYSLRTTQLLTWFVRLMSDLETRIVSIERVKEYSEIPTEAPAVIEGRRLPHGWPTEGHICFNSYSVRYREGLIDVLKEISCSIRSCEKIGIVGRTGAGKSSLTMGLFRILEAAGGSITIDDVDIATIGLQDLRSRITIIPQDPILFSGTLRHNVDPFSQFSDASIWSCLNRAHLQEFVGSLSDGLSSEVAEGGENLSVGQRQLLCLARALLRKSKILVLDEATAAVDLETDSLIQRTIREEFSDCTVLTIAHRLNTIMDSDRIMVLDNGGIVEFDSPGALLSAGGIFQSMAMSAGLV